MEEPDPQLHPAEAELIASAYCFKIGLSITTISVIILCFQWLQTAPESSMTLTAFFLSIACGWTAWWGRNLLARYANLRNRLKEPMSRAYHDPDPLR